MANSYEASDILTFDYTMDDELNDEGRLEENGKLDQDVTSSPKNTTNTNEKRSKVKNGTSNENDGDSKNDRNAKSDKKVHDKTRLKSLDKKDASKSKSSTSSNSKSSKEKEKPKEAKTETHKIYVSGITEDIKASDLQEVFTKYSTVLDAKIIRFSKIPNECFGLVTVDNEQQFSKCLQNLNKTLLKGKTILLSQNSPLKKQTKPSVSNSNQSDNKKTSTKKNGSANENKSKSKDDKPKEKEKQEKVTEKPKQDKPTEKKNSNVSKSSNVTKKSSSNNEKAKESDKSKDKERTRTRSRSKERSTPAYKIPFKKNVPIKSPLIIEQERLDRLRERRNREEMERLAMERIRYRKEKERIEAERMKLRREKLELIRLETEKIAKEREELARQRQAVEERKRSEFVAKRTFDTRDRSPEPYRNQRSNSGPRTFVDSKRYDSRESRNNYKRSKYESSIDYDNRRHGTSSNDRDDRKEFRRDSREHRFEETRRERFTEKEPTGNGYMNSPRPFAPSTTDTRNNWPAQVAAPQWNTTERWATTFDTSHPQAAALSPTIIPNTVNSMSEIYPNGFSNIPITGLAASSSYVHPPSRRF